DRKPDLGNASEGRPRMKVYVSASNPSVRVPFREVALTTGERLRLYDTSGPYTDPEYTADVKQGLLPLRRPWILSRGDVEPGAGGRGGPGAQSRRGGAPDALRPPRRDHAGDGVRRSAGGHEPGDRTRRGRAGASHHPRQHQSPGDRAHDHQPQVA